MVPLAGLFLRFVAMSAAAKPATGLLDRAAELAAIAAAVRSASAGAGSALLVEGEAGIGKTSLLAQACEQAAGAGMTVRSARGLLSSMAGTRGVWSGSCLSPKRSAAGLPADAAALATAALGRAGPWARKTRSRWCMGCG